MTTAQPGSQWKGIVLSGGKGTRLYPVTRVCSKQLLPVYDKPMVYYPISTLMWGGIRDIMIISTSEDMPHFKELLKDGSQLGIRFSYAIQPEPKGIAQAFLVGEEFIGSSSACLILGDNLFHGDASFLRRALQEESGGTIFGYAVSNPSRYGVVEFDKSGKAVSIEEKPKRPKSHFAVPGLYCYDNRVIERAKALKPSERDELEITDLNKAYLKSGELRVEVLGRGMAWLDTGTPESLLEAGSFVGTIERRQGIKIGCPEEAAFRMGYIDARQLMRLAGEAGNSSYGQYLLSIAKEETGGLIEDRG
ncbi:MAG: glucose-1-phosphate thymidylyltransferase RfbA [Lentisphaerales bacterium]|jgi:glucose-1-phosphate thymidylyltransferase|nr:MAG: glucose-1-phosphate thymidylyltransferase RfbA [Lentisphaerales bacterium]